ncbi:MAG TPA: hypothetical protein VKB75_10720, partial [Jatrophihabitans sp.]|nr:hypothetical protein [Jatrophihabitans sp.]
DLAVSAAFDPIGFAAFEAEFLAALDGWRGLSCVGVQLGALDGELRFAATAYHEADRLVVSLHDALLGGVNAIPALAAASAVLLRTGDPMRAAQVLLAHDPELADTLITALGLPGLLRAIGSAVPDGYGIARSYGIDRTGPAGRPPRRLRDLFADLAQRDGDARHGEIDVRILSMPRGSRRVIVDITGTKSWDPLPTADVTSLTTNARALVGERSAYEGGVLAAMRAAGVRRDDPVMLVGHSQGGMVAVTTARDAMASGEFNITHVVTAGAPIGMTVGSVPRATKVLALENTRDVVPHLDGVANPDRANVTTASAARGNSTVGGDHHLNPAYFAIARDVEASGNPSVRDFLSSADGYFRASRIETHAYQIQRRY